MRLTIYHAGMKMTVMRHLFLILALFLAPIARGETIHVAAAISMKDALTEVARVYEADTGQRVTFAFGSSGQIMAQVKAGAPVDVFISAAAAQMDELEKAGLIVAPSRRDIAGNALALIVPADSKLALTSFKELAGDGVKRIAIGEPKTVPAGQYAQQALRSADVLSKIADRLVFGANVRQVLSYVERGEVTAGVVYATDAKESGDKVRVVATADATSHEPIRYPAAIVKSSRKPDESGKFLEYLKGEKAAAVLAAKGFTPPPGTVSKP